jgi:hypothetical protein
MHEVNSMKMFENYPYMNKVITESNLEQYLDRIKWHTIDSDNELKVSIEQILETHDKLTSANIPEIKEGRNNAMLDYVNIASKLHVFSREQGRHELHLTNNDVAKIFSRFEIGGAKYCTQDNPQQLF